MTSSVKIALTAAAGVVIVAFSSVSASAYIVCNPWNVCWHVPVRYAYPPPAAVVIYPDTWRWPPHRHYVWREHPGRGYWRHRVWIRF